MTTILQSIQESVIKYAHMIEQITKLDVEIVDTNLNRIAGTGLKNNNLSQSMASEGHVYDQVLRTGKFIYIDNPRENALCQQCTRKNSCYEWAEMAIPITLADEIIGVIGLICFSAEAKKRIDDDLTLYQAFTKSIAEFIGAKAFEYQKTTRAMQTMDVLKEVISHVSEGILLLQNDGYVQDTNVAAEKQLQTDKLKGSVLRIEETGDTILDQKEYRITMGKHHWYVIGEKIPIYPKPANYDAIFLFNDIKNVKSTIYNLTNVTPKQQASQIIGSTPAMLTLKQQIKKIADSSSTVLITGESGTGKDLVARVIHSEGNRSDKPFVSINCGAIPDTLLESELFGYVKGAFTGADPRGKIGKFEIANKGIIFLDEIGDMPLYLQVKLLRVLQDRKISRIGSNQVIDIDVRVIAATNRDLTSLIQKNKFRRDLYYRLNVIPLQVPPLRERKEDVPELIHMLLKKYCALFNRSKVDIDLEAMKLLLEYSWPGNVRELENTIEFMINMSESDHITVGCLPENIRLCQCPKGTPSALLSEAGENAIIPLKDLEKNAILQALKTYGESMEAKQEIAKKLGIGIATLYRKLEKYKIK